MPTFEQLLNINLEPLDTAVTDWTQMITRLEQLRTEAGAMKTRADGAVWRGENATVTQPFIAKTAKEFGDAVTEAESVRDLLKDAAEKIKAAKTELKTAYETPPPGITIYPNGVLSHRVHPDRRSKDSAEPLATQADFDALRQRLEAILGRAADADQLCAWGLRSLIKDHPNDFGSTDYNSLQDAAKARQGEKDAQDRKDAQEAAKLLTRVDHLDDKERSRLLELTERGKNSPAFSAELLTHLDFAGRTDQEALLLLAANLEGGGRDGQISGAETRLLNALSGTVATATAPGAPLGPFMGPVTGSHTPWTDRLLELARNGNDLPAQHPGSIQGGAHGYGVLTKMMGAGDAKYDGAFLSSVGNSIRDWETHTKHPYEGMDKNWVGTQEDPMGGLMKAFSRNPEASTAYFDPAHGDNLNYFLKDRDWPGGDVENKMPADLLKTSARTQFGAALEAAATGHAPGIPVPEIPAKHDPVQAAIFSQTVMAYGHGIADDPSEMPAGLRSSMGGMFADYAGDVHQILGKDVDTRTSYSGLDIPQKDLVPVMRAIGEDPRAFGQMLDAQTTYTAQEINKHDGAAFVRKDAPGSAELGSFVAESNRALGTMDAIRADVIFQKGEDEKSANGWNKMMQYHMIGAPVTGIPLAGDTLQRLVDIGTTEYLNNLNSQVDKETRGNLASQFSAGQDTVNAMLRQAVTDKFPPGTQLDLDSGTGQFEGVLQRDGKAAYNDGLNNGSGFIGRRR